MSDRLSTPDPNEPFALQAGPLSLVFNRGEIRWVRLGEREVLRSIYVAVRPPTWDTVPGEIQGLEVERTLRPQDMVVEGLAGRGETASLGPQELQVLDEEVEE